MRTASRLKQGLIRLGARATLLCAAGLLVSPGLFAQPAAGAATGAAARGTPAPSARAQAAFDPTGYWVSLITQNWRYRMVVPGKGEYADVPINLKAKQIADAWSAGPDEAGGKACEAYGAAIIMRNPERLHMAWLDDNTLRVDTDEGMQTRLLHFLPPAVPSPAGEIALPPPTPQTEPASLQGHSVARWIFSGVQAGGAAPAVPPAAPNRRRSGSLVVDTDDLSPGLLRKNGIPYGAQTRTREYWDLRQLDGQQWITVSVQVTDPEYLQTPYVYDVIFQKEPDSSKWAPAPCTLGS